VHVRLDEVDRAILERLEDDGRASYRQIARDVGVSEGTVRSRVGRLQRSGVLRILAFVDPSKLGGAVLALLFVTAESEHQDAVVEALTAMPEVAYVSSLIGRADVYTQIICTDNSSLWSLVRRIRALPGVTSTETMLELAVHKFSYRDAAAHAGRG
jgi:Lrp/AsnC family transcriptional regulator, regulator for asnA, asnC and gidA